MKNAYLMLRSLLVLVMLVGITVASTAWAGIDTGYSSVASLEQQTPAPSDQSNDAVEHFDEEREQERDGGEEGFVSGLTESGLYIVRQPTAIMLTQRVQSLSASVFKIPII